MGIPHPSLYITCLSLCFTLFYLLPATLATHSFPCCGLTLSQPLLYWLQSSVRIHASNMTGNGMPSESYNGWANDKGVGCMSHLLPRD